MFKCMIARPSKGCFWPERMFRICFVKGIFSESLFRIAFLSESPVAFYFATLDSQGMLLWTYFYDSALELYDDRTVNIQLRWTRPEGDGERERGRGVYIYIIIVQNYLTYWEFPRKPSGKATHIELENHLVGGLEHVLFSIIYRMSSFPLTFIFFKMVKTTNQLSVERSLYDYRTRNYNSTSVSLGFIQGVN